jgi:hypothetical protein
MKKWLFLRYLLYLFLGQNMFIFAQDISQLSAKKPLKVTGSLGTRTYFSAGSQSPLYAANPFGYSLSGNLNLTFFNGISVPLSLTYSNRKANFSQPFNQFGMSPTYKGFTVHGGYRSLRFSEYTLNGFTMLGGGFEVQKAKIRAGFMYGLLGRATATDAGIPIAFQRDGWAAKVGFGKDNNFVDLVLFKASDDPSTIVNYEAYKLNPAKNVAIGLAINKRIFKIKNQTLQFTADGALSIYTGDINARAVNEEDLSVVIPPVIFNAVDANFSSQGLFALNSGLNYSTKGFSVRLNYQRIDPGFASMGIYTTNNDIEVISIAPRISFLKNKLIVNANVRQQRDNLLGIKLRTTKRILPSGSISYTPSQKFGLTSSITFSNMNQTQGIKVTTPVDTRKLIAQTNYSIMFMPRFSFGSEAVPQSVNVSIGTNKLLDNGEDADRKKYSEYSGLNGSLNYNYAIEKSNLNLNAGANYFSLTTFNAVSNAPVASDNFGFNAGADKGFLKNKLSTNLAAGYTLGTGGNNALSLNLGANYRPAKNHSFGFTAYQANSKFTDSIVRNFNEFRGTFDYTYNF